MPRRKRSPAAPDRIGDRLAAAQRSGFVGRREELALFRSALGPGRPFTLLHVHGPGGVGKTTLLRELARLAREAGRPVVALDGRDIPPSPSGFLRALGDALARRAQAEPPAPEPPGDAVVLVDTYELLSALDGWLRQTLLPSWPAGVLVAVAGREAPALAWTTDIAWSPLTRVLRLANLAPEEGRAFLRVRGVSPANHARVLAFTHGHPLALALVADLLRQRPGLGAFDPAEAPDIVGHLSGLFLEAVSGDGHREAVDACAVARVTTLPLLVHLLGEERGPAAFEWLRRQSFVESGPRGLVPHELVREVVIADARWRDTAALGRLSRRIYTALTAQIAAASGRERQRLQMDALYVTRIRSTHASFFDWSALDDARVEPAQPADAPWIFDLVARHEGPAPAELARGWWRAQPSAFQVFHGADGRRFGFLALLDLGGPGPQVEDPATTAARAFVEAHGPARRGEGVVYLRWWMHADVYQAVTAAINLTAMHVISHCLTRPAMAWNFVAMADPGFWEPHFTGVNFPRVPGADFEVGGRRFGVFAHDWRVDPPADWMMGVRVPMPFAAPSAAPGSPAPASPAEFQRAVRQALRDYTRPDALAAGPLGSSRLAHGAGDAPARAAALQALLRSAGNELRAHPRDQKLYRAVWHTYFEPLPTQELAAERLGLPFSTYRRHLAAGIERIARWLWSRERATGPA
jgi:hypothetical protein